MEEIQLKDAKATLSAVVDRAIETHRPQAITRHNKKVAVLLSWEDYERLSSIPTFGRLLMAAPIETGDIPERNREPESHRTVEF
ncbi:type II toxin-antitoxin system Phd/YefM family antitoxin [Microvirga roseola]|uniref:type II toxin-antitoxin system Phd/YefM family antitoxin n=1 Tax=Microvirga roseola TaxID=2883126 RepID=UPI001E5ACC18|nr:type II toxin-antitoxin system Phd/YefM family antitoxin [Microvirga roseola]